MAIAYNNNRRKKTEIYLPQQTRLRKIEREHIYHWSIELRLGAQQKANDGDQSPSIYLIDRAFGH